MGKFVYLAYDDVCDPMLISEDRITSVFMTYMNRKRLYEVNYYGYELDDDGVAHKCMYRGAYSVVREVDLESGLRMLDAAYEDCEDA